MGIVERSIWDEESPLAGVEAAAAAIIAAVWEWNGLTRRADLGRSVLR
jgi:hypothetical protein